MKKIFNKVLDMSDKILFQEYFLKKKNFLNYSNEIRQNYKKKNFINSISKIQYILNFLKKDKFHKIVDLKNIIDVKEENINFVAFRCDIDAGVWSLEKMSKLFNKYNLSVYFYILINSYYYGQIFKNNIERNTFFFKNYLSKLKNENQKVGIHNDIYGLIKSGHNGIRFLKQEINWLNKKNYNIISSSAHNSAYVYGAENFQIFKEFSNSINKKFFLKNYNLKTGMMSQKSLGLTFEANFPEINLKKKELRKYFKKRNDPIRNKIWLTNHFLKNPIYTSRYDVDIWVTGKNSWFIADRKSRKIYFNKNINEIINFFKTEKEKKIVLNLHPEYFE